MADKKSTLGLPRLYKELFVPYYHLGTLHQVLVLTLRLISCVPEALCTSLPLSGKSGLKCVLNTPLRDARKIRRHHENESVLKSGKHDYFFKFLMILFPPRAYLLTTFKKEGRDFFFFFLPFGERKKNIASQKKTETGRHMQSSSQRQAFCFVCFFFLIWW